MGSMASRWLLLLGTTLLLAGPALPQRELDTLLAKVREEEDAVHPRVFRQIAAHGSRKAFETLRDAVGALRKEPKLNRAYGAFAAFADDPALARASVDLLHDEAWGHRREENQRAAARALARFGELAFEELEHLLTRHREDSVRRVAAQPLIPRLGEAGTLDAAETILDLADLRSGAQEQVVYRALLACEGRRIDGLYAERLLDPDTPERWRALLLSVLGSREGRRTTRAVVRALEDPSATVRTHALAILGGRGERSATRLVRRSLRSEDAGELRQAVVTLGRLLASDADWEDELVELARDPRAAVRLGAAVALLELRTPAAIEALHRLLGDPDWRVRVEALEQVADLRRRRSVPVLIDRLDVERGRLRRDVALVLRLLTGLDHGTSAARWNAWWRAEGEAFRLPPAEVARAAEKERAQRRRTNQTTASFYGMEVVSDRVAFVVDTSGSMSQRAGSKGRTSAERDQDTGPTRLDVANEELTNALKRISPGVLFNVVFFSSGVAPWQDELLAKDEETEAAALAFTGRQRPGGGTNLFDALLAALEDRRVDTIYVLSDGDPTAGQAVEPALILERIGELNRTRKIQVHCISIGKRSEFLEALAGRNGGAYKESL